MLKYLSTFFASFFIFSSLGAQSASEIYLSDFKNRDGIYELSKHQCITSYKGYNNQPSFDAKGKNIYFSSIRDNQSDIYRYDLKTKKEIQVTNTSESEYSPTLIPGQVYFSTVRVEEDGTQRLWKFSLKNPTNPPELVSRDVKKVGYHLWLGNDQLALFLVKDPISLEILDLKSGKVEKKAEKIGRSLQMVPSENAFSYVDKTNKNEWWINTYHLDRDEIKQFHYTQDKSEDYVWTSDGSLVMAQGSQIYYYNPKKFKDWRLLADLSSLGVKNITRLALDKKNKKLAWVASK